MAALSHADRVVVRAARPGEGPRIAELWLDLWNIHERWGGYPGSRDARVYAQLANRLNDDARVRSGHPILGRHVHLVAERRGELCGQVEGWLDYHGVDPKTPHSCDVRSLFVDERARGCGVGRALLDGLASAARSAVRHKGCVLAAEVLEPNPAHAFYAKVGYVPVSFCARIAAGGAARGPTQFFGRRAVAEDALGLARLETELALRRGDAGDPRFDGPRPITPPIVASIAAHLATAGRADPATLVAVGPDGQLCAAASFAIHSLEPPFLPLRRALLGRFALDPEWPAAALLAPLVAQACRLASAEAAQHIEMTDLPPPGSDLYTAALALGASPWSRIVIKPA